MNKKQTNIRYILLCVFCIITLYSQAQRETYNWFFGNGAGLTWNETQSFEATGLFGTQTTTFTDLPALLTGSSITTYEGCYSLSDPHGKLLFYSDGRTIWNKTHDIMENGTGMEGDNSSAQSGIIIPFPGHPNQYVSVSIMHASNDIMSYSIVDMNQNDGLGKVTTKNIRFAGYSGNLGESVASIRHPNGIDYWIVAPGRGTPTYFNTWRVTSSGVSQNPIKITIPQTVTPGTTGGYFKFSPNGKHFAWATWTGGGHVIYGNFDAYTGQFSNIRSFSSDAYGIEFSPSGDYLYFSDGRDGPNIYVYDFNRLLSGDQTQFKTFSYPRRISGAFQLGPDGRIYFVSQHSSEDYYDSQCLFFVDNPDDYSNLKFYQLKNYFPRSYARMGLPAFCASWFALSIQGAYSFCKDTPQSYTITMTQDVGGAGEQIAYTEWDFGDGSPIIKDTNVTSGTQTHTHTYAKPGEYTLTVRSYLASGLQAVQESLAVTAYPCVLPVNPNVHQYETVK